MKPTTRILAAAVLFLAPVTVVASPHTLAADRDPRPNILLVRTDDQTYESLTSMAHVQALARRGFTFTDYHANFPCAARAEPRR